MRNESIRQEPGGVIKCATYGRYSSNMQRPASLEDQVRSCEAGGQQKGWILLPDHIYQDAAISGTSTVGRSGLEALLAQARRRDCPFRAVLIDDTSRLGRNLGDVLKITELLKHLRIRVYFVSQKLDSEDPNFRLMLTVFGMADEQQIERLRAKVHSGQKGRVLQGYSSGSRCFGYKSVRKDNPDMPDATGRAGTIGVKWEVIEEEAEVVRRVFDLFGDGYSMFQIARAFNERGIRGPRKPRIGDVATAWNANLIKNILRREKYRGWIVWNQTHQTKDPETGQVILRRKDDSEHVWVEAPHLRIVTDEQWNRAVERLKQVSEKNARRVLGGLNRAKKKFYLFSGILYCGECGEKMRIAGGKNIEASYECPNHRYRRGCSNSIRMREDRMCDQLIDVLARKLLLPDNFKYLTDEVWAEINRFMDTLRREGPGTELQRLERAKATLQVERHRLIRFIRSMDHPPASIGSDLASIDSDLAQIDEQLRNLIVPESVEISKADLEALVACAIQNLQEVLKGDPISARQLLHHHVKRLELHPAEGEDGNRLFEVLGEIDLFSVPEGTSERVLLDYGRRSLRRRPTGVSKAGFSMAYRREDDATDTRQSRRSAEA